MEPTLAQTLFMRLNDRINANTKETDDLTPRTYNVHYSERHMINEVSREPDHPTMKGLK